MVLSVFGGKDTSRFCQKAAVVKKLHNSGNCLVLAAAPLTFAGKHRYAMTKKQRQDLLSLEKSIKKTVRYVEGHGCGKPLSSLDAGQKEALEEALSVRQNLLNDMFLCTQEEVMDFRRTNERLYALTQKMHEKAISLYRALLEEGYDPDFDDDIMVEGTLKFVFNDALGSVMLSDKEKRTLFDKPLEPYGSDFPAMLEILSEYYEDALMPECASCSVSYKTSHHAQMDAREYGLENYLDDGKTWAEPWPLGRDEFADICICHAVHDLCTHKLYSVPDLLRMNDFWCEVRITHQLLSDRDGRRFSFIGRKDGED